MHDYHEQGFQIPALNLHIWMQCQYVYWQSQENLSRASWSAGKALIFTRCKPENPQNNTTLSALIRALEAIATIVRAAQICADQIRAARIKASEIFQLINVSRHKWTLADACASKQWKDQLGTQCWSYWWILVDHVIIISFIGSHSPIEHSYMYLSASSRTVTLYIKSVFEMIAVPSIIVVVI